MVRSPLAALPLPLAAFRGITVHVARRDGLFGGHFDRSRRPTRSLRSVTLSVLTHLCGSVCRVLQSADPSPAKRPRADSETSLVVHDSANAASVDATRPEAIEPEAEPLEVDEADYMAELQALFQSAASDGAYDGAMEAVGGATGSVDTLGALYVPIVAIGIKHGALARDNLVDVVMRAGEGEFSTIEYLEKPDEHVKGACMIITSQKGATTLTGKGVVEGVHFMTEAAAQNNPAFAVRQEGVMVLRVKKIPKNLNPNSMAQLEFYAVDMCEMIKAAAHKVATRLEKDLFVTSEEIPAYLPDKLTYEVTHCDATCTAGKKWGIRTVKDTFYFVTKWKSDGKPIAMRFLPPILQAAAELEIKEVVIASPLRTCDTRPYSDTCLPAPRDICSSSAPPLAPLTPSPCATGAGICGGNVAVEHASSWDQVQTYAQRVRRGLPDRVRQVLSCSCALLLPASVRQVAKGRQDSSDRAREAARGGRCEGGQAFPRAQRGRPWVDVSDTFLERPITRWRVPLCPSVRDWERAVITVQAAWRRRQTQRLQQQWHRAVWLVGRIRAVRARMQDLRRRGAVQWQQVLAARMSIEWQRNARKWSNHKGEEQGSRRGVRGGGRRSSVLTSAGRGGDGVKRECRPISTPNLCRHSGPCVEPGMGSGWLHRLSSVLWRRWVDVRAWIVRVSGEAENPGPRSKSRARHVNDLRIGFLNAHSLGDNIFRKYLLAQYRRKFDIFAVAETWCPDVTHETMWARDWKGSGGTVWASGPERTSSTSRGHWGKGVAIFFAKELGEVTEHATVLYKDPCGRALAIRCKVYNRTSVFVVVHARNESDREQADFYTQLGTHLPKRESGVDYYFLMDANNAPWWKGDRRTLDGTREPEQTRPLGVQAMQKLMERFEVVDTFRHLHPHQQEYTRSHKVNGQIVSQSRLDRIYVSRHMLVQRNLPVAVGAGHVWPEQTDMAALRRAGSESKWSDHATVTCTIQYTDVKHAPTRPCMPRHVFDELAPVTEMRARATAAYAAAAKDPLERLEQLISSSMEYVTEHVQKRTRAHRKQKQHLINQLKANDRFLGVHCSPGEVERIDDAAERMRRAQAAQEQRVSLDRQLLDLVSREQTRWARDRGYEEYTQADTCCRAFFEDARDARVYSHIEKLRGPHGHTHTTMKALLKEAKRHYGAKGSIFNLQRVRDREDDTSREVLMDALRADGRCVPAHLRDCLSVDALFDDWNVQYAIEEMATGKAAGDDGVPADWYRVVGARVKVKDVESGEFRDEPSDLTKLMAAAFRKIHADRVAPAMMRNAVVSLLYKEKGERFNLKYYRPIAVANAVGKILEKAMVLRMRPLLDHVISPEQKAFQQRKYIAENTQLVQDVIAHCNNENQSGMLVFCDQDNAYPRVEWDFMALTMRTMGVHEDFIRMVDLMYKDSTLQIKINGHVGEAFHPTNSVAQGSPLSPLLYLLVIQSFISLVHQSRALSSQHEGLGVIEGISVPGSGGDLAHPTALRVLGFADDLVVFLRDGDELPAFQSLLRVYERGAGAVNSWEKTHAMRVGALRGSDELPAGWEEGRDIDTSGAAIRYLGIFLGCEEAVAAQWEKRITQKMERRFDRWCARGAPATRRGRNIVIRNHVNAVAWYMVQAQTPANVQSMMEVWRQMGWRFFEAPLHAIDMSGRGQARVERLTLIQDYPESGVRCQDVELFAKALYMRQVGRLATPSSHRGVDLVMAWVNRAYGHLRMGRRLLISSCDWLMLPDEMPMYWRLALKNMGQLRGLVPWDGTHDGQQGRTPEVTYRSAREGVARTVRVGGEWSLGRVLMEPLFYNPHLSGWWGAAVLDEAEWVLNDRVARAKVVWSRQSDGRVADATEVYRRSQQFARLGITHVCHLLTGSGKLMSWEQLRGVVGRRGQDPCTQQEYGALLGSIPSVWRDVLNHAAASWPGGSANDALRRAILPPGAWTCAIIGGRRMVTRVGGGDDTVYEWHGSGELRGCGGGDHHATAAEVRRVCHGWTEVAVWEDGGQSAASVRREEWGEASARAHTELGQPKKMRSLVCGGRVVSAALLPREASTYAGWSAGIDPGRWAVQYGETTRVRRAVPLTKLAVKHLYYLQLSRLFHLMRTFDPARVPLDWRRHTTWVDLMQETEAERHARDKSLDDSEREYEVQRIVTHRPSRRGNGVEYLVEWCGYGEEERSWEPEGDIWGTQAVAEYETWWDTGGRAEGQLEEAVSQTELKMAYRIFSGLQHQDVPRGTADRVYSVLADALPVGEGRCVKTAGRRGVCDICSWLRGEQCVETCRHVGAECPCTMLVQEAVLREAFHVSMVDERERAQVRVMGWRELALAHRRLLVTGYRHAARASQMAEERAGHTPFRVLMETLMSAIVQRRHHNAHALGSLQLGVGEVYGSVRRELLEVAQWTHQRAVKLEERLRIMRPEWRPKEGEGPVMEWEKAWVASGFVDWRKGELVCRMAESSRGVRGAAVNSTHAKAVARMVVEGSADGVRVALRLAVGAVPPVDDACFAEQLGPPAWVAYTDGGESAGMAGWGWILTTGGDGEADAHAIMVAEGFGPVVTEEGHPAYLGARKHSNNTGELSAMAELLLALLGHAQQPVTARGVVRPDSELAMGVMTGRVSVSENVELAQLVRARWCELRARHGGAVTLQHVKGHSGHVWNDRVDESAERGRQGEVQCGRCEWREARDVAIQPDLVSNSGRFALAARRIFLLRRSGMELRVATRTLVQVHSLRWVGAGQYPAVDVKCGWDHKEVESAVAHAWTCAEDYACTLTASSTIALLLHPSVTEAWRAEEGVRKLCERLEVETVVHRIRRGARPRVVATALWQTQQLAQRVVQEVAAVWCQPVVQPHQPRTQRMEHFTTPAAACPPMVDPSQRVLQAALDTANQLERAARAAVVSEATTDVNVARAWEHVARVAEALNTERVDMAGEANSGTVNKAVSETRVAQLHTRAVAHRAEAERVARMDEDDGAGLLDLASWKVMLLQKAAAAEDGLVEALRSNTRCEVMASVQEQQQRIHMRDVNVPADLLVAAACAAQDEARYEGGLGWVAPARGTNCAASSERRGAQCSTQPQAAMSPGAELCNEQREAHDTDGVSDGMSCEWTAGVTAESLTSGASRGAQLGRSDAKASREAQLANLPGAELHNEQRDHHEANVVSGEESCGCEQQVEQSHAQEACGNDGDKPSQQQDQHKGAGAAHILHDGTAGRDVQQQQQQQHLQREQQVPAAEDGAAQHAVQQPCGASAAAAQPRALRAVSLHGNGGVNGTVNGTAFVRSEEEEEWEATQAGGFQRVGRSDSPRTPLHPPPVRPIPWRPPPPWIRPRPMVVNAVRMRQTTPLPQDPDAYYTHICARYARFPHTARHMPQLAALPALPREHGTHAERVSPPPPAGGGEAHTVGGGAGPWPRDPPAAVGGFAGRLGELRARVTRYLDSWVSWLTPPPPS